MPVAHLSTIDVIVMLVYFAFVLGMGWALSRYMRTSTDFFLSGRSIPAWVAGLAFLSANLGAQEVIGMARIGRQVRDRHQPLLLGRRHPGDGVRRRLFMMPFYYGSRARSVPEYLKLRFDEKTRALNAVSFAVMTVFSSGISMYAMAKLLLTPAAGLGLQPQHAGRCLHRAGLHLPRWPDQRDLQRSAAVLPDRGRACAAGVCWGSKNVGGWSGLKAKLATEAVSQGFQPGAYTHAWQYMDSAAHNPIGVEWFGLVMGLGFVLSFGYWCTDFLVVQRAMAADSLRPPAARL